MKYKDYSQDIWKQIHTTLDQVLEQDSEPIAAFDADGTLWDTDLGEAFFHHQIDNRLVALPKDPWEHYQQLKKNSPPEAYLWLAQICQGKPLSQIHDWAKEALELNKPTPIFLEQKKLIELFLSKGVQIYVVTASVKWAVEPGMSYFGLDYENVIGVETDVQQGIVTNQQKGAISYQAGKVEALLQKTGGKKPFFASGNTMGDYQMLRSATHLQLAVSAASRDDRLFKTEMELAQKAQAHQWLSHRFI